MRPALVRMDPHSALTQLRSPWPAWLVVLSGLVIFSPLIEGGTTHVPAMIIRLMVLALFSLYLVKGLRAGALTCPRVPIAPALLAFLGLACLSTFRSPYTSQSLQWLIVLVSYVGLLYLLVYFMDQWDHVGKLLAVLVGTGLVEAIMALSQMDWSGSTRPSATFFNPNFLAGYLAAVLTILLGSLCYSRGLWRRRRGIWTVRRTSLIPWMLSVAGLAVFLLAILCTRSRGGMLAVLAGTSVVVGLRFGRRGLLVLVLFFGVLLTLASPLRDRVQAEHAVNPLGYARLQVWNSSVQAMREHPLGVGLGLYQYVSPRYAFPVEGQIARYRTLAKTAHNEYLQMGVELGLLSIPVFCWGIGGVVREAGAALAQRLTRWQRGLVVGAGGAMTAILVQAAVDSNLHTPALAIVLTLCVGVLLSARTLCGRVTSPVCALGIQSAWSRTIWSGAAIVVVGLLAIGVTRLGLAWVAFEAGSQAADKQNYSKAVANDRTAIALDPEKALYHSAIAAMYFHEFQETDDPHWAKASLAELKSAVALNPLDGRLSGLLGRVYRALSSSKAASGLAGDSNGETEENWLRLARSAYERAAVLEPFNPFHRLELGRLYLAQGEPNKAEAVVRRALDMEPNFLPGRAWLTRFYLDSTQLDAATTEYREIVTRRERYARRTKGPIEKRFLAADVSALEASFKHARSHL